MDLTYIYSTFKSLQTNTQKVKFLQELQSLNLPYDINYQNLIHYYSTN
jgi:hypothetical protein